MVEIAHDKYSRTSCADPHGCVEDVLAHQALDGHVGHTGEWARMDDVEPTADALEWSLVNAEPFTPDCLSAPDYDNDFIQSACPSLLLTPAAAGTSGSVRLRAGVLPPSGEYPVSTTVPQAEQLKESVFVANSPDPQWQPGKCVAADGQSVPGVITLSLALIGADEALQKQECHALCMAHQTPPEWRDMKTYASGRKRGCELVTGVGWPTRGCYLHTSPKTQTANGSPHHFCKIFNLPSAARRRRLLSASAAAPGGADLRALAQVAPNETDASEWGHSVAPRQRVAGAAALSAPTCVLPKPANVVPQYVVLRDGQVTSSLCAALSERPC
jgi:hypothetical protein